MVGDGDTPEAHSRPGNPSRLIRPFFVTVAKATAAANINFDLILAEALQVTTDAGATRVEACAVMQEVFPAINVGC